MSTSQATGLLIVHTGNGKGKTSAALNLVYRHLAHGLSAAVVQLIKNPDDFAYGDIIMLERLAAQGMPVRCTMVGGGYTWKKKAADEDRRLAATAWNEAAGLIADPDIDLVLIDELHIALAHGFLDLPPVLDAIRARPSHCHVVTTGRGAPEALIAAADLVTDFQVVKHPFEVGVKAQAGIEW